MESIDARLLESIGLSPGEALVYLALLKCGSKTVTPLAKASGITASKIYPITDRLIEKGMASFIIKNNVKHFSATNPSRIKEFLDRREEELAAQRKRIDDILPRLLAQQSMNDPEVRAEVLIGWKGMQTVYDEMIDTLKRGECDYVIGASAGRSYEKAKAFYERVMERAFHKGIKFKVIGQERIRSHFEEYRGSTGHIERKYIEIAAYAETNIYRDVVLIIIHGENPTVVKIASADAAASYKEYFESLWRVAKK
jgi:sugar-specific transcriptional regulator TrmB